MNPKQTDKGISGAAGQAEIRMATAQGHDARKAELLSLAQWYAQRGDAETAADYRAQAERLG